jgi:Dolichyl-phosphate-mannose-protein mannosyltransferase
MRKALHLLNGSGPQEAPEDPLSYHAHPYTHPYFGQLFLAGTLGMIGYPDSLHPSTDIKSIETLYTIPRVLIGLLAVVDTFLLYKISQRLYNRNVALIASVLFAVMPLTWILRRIWLEPIQLPFLLTSILLALYLKDSINNNRKNIVLILLSGISLGTAIFTKIPVFTLIPLVGFLIYTNSNNNNNTNSRRRLRLRNLGLWFIPVVLIPFIWPAYSLAIGQFDQWLDGVFWQAGERGENNGAFRSVNTLMNMDPLLIALTFAGLVYAAIKREFIIFLWIIPFMIFLFVIGHVSYWHLIPLFPAFCIVAAKVLVDLSSKITNKNIQKIAPYAIISGIGLFGLISITMLITMNMTSFHYEVEAFLAQHIRDMNYTTDNKITMLASNYWLWLPMYVYDENHDNDYKNFYAKGQITTDKILFVGGENFVRSMVRDNRTRENVQELRMLYDKSKILTTIEEKDYSKIYPDRYPYTAISNIDPKASKRIEIKANY